MTEQQLVQRVAAKAVIESEGGILVLKPSKIDRNQKWHMPGGIRDDIAESIEAVAIREVREETGIDLSGVPGKVLCVGEWQAADKGEQVKVLAVFFYFKLAKRPEISLSHEHDDFAWLNKTTHKTYSTNPEVHEIIDQLL